MDQSDYINLTVDNAVSNIWMGVLFAAIVLLVFLRDIGATLSLTIAMPCCILFTFLIMNVLRHHAEHDVARRHYARRRHDRR